MINHTRLTLVSTLGVLALLGGCASTTPPTHFYVLSAPPASEVGQIEHRADPGPAVGVGPVALPAYLDRPELVTRSSHNELRLAEFDQWAEPLKDNFAEVLADNLAQLVPTERVAVFPWKRAARIDYQVIVDVTRFETQGGAGELRARWSLVAGADRRELLSRQARYRESVQGTGKAAEVAALNRALGKLSGDIAQALQGVARQAKGGSLRRRGSAIADRYRY